MKMNSALLLCIFLCATVLSAQVDAPNRSLLHKADAEKHQRYLAMSLYEDTLHAFDVQKYTVDMWIDIPNDSIWAILTGLVQSTSDTLSRLNLHFVGLTIDSILVGGSATTFTRPDSHLMVNLPSPVLNGDTASYKVFYHGEPVVGGGIFGGGLTINDTITYADNEPYGTKRWLPLYDLPSDKALLETNIHVPSGYRAVSNGALLDSVTTGQWWSWHWREDHTIASYLIVVAASNQFAVLKDSFDYSTYTMPIRHWVSEEDSADMEYRFRNTSDMLYWFSETYTIYPFIDEKYGHVSAPIGGAMEDQTNTFFNTDANWGSDWDWVVAHELSHMWWGDWVTCGTWKDIWLNEGFATFSEPHWYWYRDGEPAYHYYMEHYVMDYYKNYEPYPPYPCYDPDFLFSVVTYEKGACVLHMLRHIVGDSLFFELLTQYGTTYAEGSAVTAEFTAKAEEVTAMELDWFFDEWVYKAGYPRYEYGWWSDTLAADSFRVNLHIEQVQSHNWNVPTFKMPIDIYVMEAGGDTTKTVVQDSLDWQEFDIYTDGTPLDLAFDPGNWILKTATQVPAGIIDDGRIRRDLLSVYPNPCSKVMWISFMPADRQPYDVRIYDITGREINAFAGRDISTVWNLRDSGGARISNGIYFIRCVRGNRTLAAGKAIVF